MSGVVTVLRAEIQVRGPGGDVFLECPFEEALVADVLAAEPWRTFRWHKGQMHFSGSFWSATEVRPVIYESLLELAWLLQADFGPAVSRIIAQPSLMTAHVDGRERRHIPDFLLLRANGPQVVDVKPASRLERPEVAFTFAWSRQVHDSRPSPCPGGRWPIQVNPDDIDHACFRDLDGRPHELVWEHAAAREFPLSLDALDFARRLAASRHTRPDDRVAVAELLNAGRSGWACP